MLNSPFFLPLLAMKQLTSILLILILVYGVLSSGPAAVHAADNEALIAEIVETTERFFVSMKEKEYGTVWSLITRNSQEDIIDAVAEEMEKNGTYLSEDAIRSDFDNHGLLLNSYWNAFLNNFDPNLVLRQSKWEMGPINGDEAEVTITYRKSDLPARVLMFRENGAWKIGFTETFLTRKF